MKGWLFAAALFALTALAQTFQVASGEARYRVREELLQVVAVEFAHPVPAHADGELLPEASLYRAEVRPLGLRVVGGRAGVQKGALSPRPVGA